MIVFKRGPLELIKSLVIAVVTGVMIAFIGSIFTESIILYIIAIAISVILIYMAFNGENIKFEIDGEQFRYYQKNKLKNIYDINNCSFRYNAKGTDGDYDDINLYISNIENPEHEECIDCSSLGFDKFNEMFEVLTKDKAPAIMEAVKKEE